jgi:hypothetical protein
MKRKEVIKLKKLTVLLVVVLAMVVLAGCDWLPFLPGPDEPVEPVETLSASVELINWIQEEDVVTVTYEIINVGTVDIAHYKTMFKLTYADASVYKTEWYEEAEGIAFAGKETVVVEIENVPKEVARVDIEEYKLTEWKW